jgi:hypothetical protein
MSVVPLIFVVLNTDARICVKTVKKCRDAILGSLNPANCVIFVDLHVGDARYLFSNQSKFVVFRQFLRKSGKIALKVSYRFLFSISIKFYCDEL